MTNIASFLQFLGTAGLSTGAAVYGIYALNSGSSLLNFNLIYPTGYSYLSGIPLNDALPLIYNGPGNNPSGVLTGQGFYQISDQFTSDFSVIMSLGYSGCLNQNNLNQILSSTSLTSGASLFITPSNRLSISTPDYNYTIPREIGVNDFAYFSVLGGRYANFGLWSMEDNSLYSHGFDEGSSIISVADLYFGGSLAYSQNFTGYSGKINSIYLFSGNLTPSSIQNVVNASFVTGFSNIPVAYPYVTFSITGSLWSGVSNIQTTGITQILSYYPNVNGGSGQIYIDSGITGSVTTNQALIPLTTVTSGTGYSSGISFLFNSAQMMSGILSDFYFTNGLFSGDVVEIYTYQIYNPNFNNPISNFQYPSSPNTVQIYANGLADTDSVDYTVAFNNLIVGYDPSDILQYDIYPTTITGPYSTGFLQTGTTGAAFVNITGVSGLTMAGFNFDIYLNGQKMVSGVNFSVAGTQLTVSGNDLMDINDADCLEIKFVPIYPNIIQNTFQITQNQSYISGLSGFSPMVFLNGLRQMGGLDYLKVPRCRFCSGAFNEPNYNFPLYNSVGNSVSFTSITPRVLTAGDYIGGGTTALNWTYSGSIIPAQWQVYYSNTSYISWARFGAPTNTFSASMYDAGFYWVVRGVDVNGNPVIPISNIVYH